MMKNKNILKKVLLLSFLAMATNAVAQSTKVPANTIKAVDGTYQTSANNIGLTYKGDLDDLKIDNSNSVKLTSSSIVGGIGGVYPASLEFAYNIKINSGTPYYFRLKKTSSFSSALLGGALGGFLDAALFGTHWIQVTPFLDNAVVNGGGRTDNYWNQTADSNLSVMEDASLNKYIRIVPSSDYNKIKFVDWTAGGLVAVNESEIEYAYHYDNVSRCDIPIMTSYTGGGGLLSILQSAPVTNAHQAIDTDLNTYSTIGITSLLNVTTDGTVEQFFHLPEAVNDKSVRITMQLPVSLLNLALAKRSSVVFYKDGKPTPVSTVQINEDLIGLDLLGLINGNDAIVSFAAVPKDALGNIIPFDKVGIRINIPVGLDLLGGSNIRVYDVAIINNKPVRAEVCTKEFITPDNIREIKFDITKIIPNYNAANTYTISDVNGTAINHLTDKWQPLGSYVIKGITGSTDYCPQDNVNFMAVQDTQYRLNGAFTISKPLDADDDGTADAQHTFLASNYKIVDFDNFNADVSADYEPVKIFRESDNADVTGVNLAYTQIGSYNYYAKTKHKTADCEIVRRITVYVYDKAECEYRYEQLMADDEEASTVTLLGIPLGGTSQSAKSIDKDLSTHGSVFNVISLLGIGTTSQKLLFTETPQNTLKQIPAGTPVTIKLGQEYSLLQLIGAVTVRPIDTFGNPVGPFLSVGEADLLSLLVGDNVFEYTFIPKGTDGNPMIYSGVQVNLGSVLGLGNTTKVFGAYIDERKALANATCNPNITVNGAETPAGLDQTVLLNTSAKDILWGVQDAGLGVATALSGVAYPYLAADAINNVGTPLHGTSNYNTAAIFNTSVGALNRQTLTVKFKEIARPGDRVRVVLSAQGAPVLDLNLLQGFTMQRYMGNTPIGDEVTTTGFELIKLDLLELIANQSSDKYVVVLEGIGAPFDRVEIRLDNVVSANILGDKTYIHDVALIPYFSFDGDGDTTLLCTSAPFEIEKMDPCTNYELSYASPERDPITDAITGWNDILGSEIVIANENDVRVQYRLQMKELIKTYNQAGTLYMKVVTKRQGCIYGDAQYLKVKVAACGSIVNPMIRTRLTSN